MNTSSEYLHRLLYLVQCSQPLIQCSLGAFTTTIPSTAHTFFHATLPKYPSLAFFFPSALLSLLPVLRSFPFFV